MDAPKTPNNPLKPPTPIKSVNEVPDDLISRIKEFFSRLIDLRDGLDRYGAVKRIKENKRMQGANAWTLMCSIMIASLGLDLNSPAVIIGAMLISPLMSPILGVGLAVGINDKETLWISVRHFMVAIGIAIFTSFLYFFLTPFGEPTSEILSRTKPTVLDVLVAFFGGLAGIISGTRKDASNAIPGVAIATALMPPLCVSGFGIANLLKHGIEHNGTNFLLVTSNSFYLFFLNATFVALATYLIIRLLRFPYKEHASPKEQRRNQLIVFFAGLLLLIPSFIILSTVLSDNRNEAAIRKYVRETFSETTICNINKQLSRDTFEVTIQLFSEIPDSTKQNYVQQIRTIVPNSNLTIRNPNFLDINDVNASVEEKIIAITAEQRSIITDKDRAIESLSVELDQLKSKKRLEATIPEEVKIVFPDIETIQFFAVDSTNARINIPTLLINWKDNKRRTKEEDQLKEFVKYRAKLDTIQIAKMK